MTKEEFIDKIKEIDATVPNEYFFLEYNKYVYDILEENEKYKEVIDSLIFIKNRARSGATQEAINKLAINFINAYLKEVE